MQKFIFTHDVTQGDDYKKVTEFIKQQIDKFSDNEECLSNIFSFIVTGYLDSIDQTELITYCWKHCAGNCFRRLLTEFFDYEQFDNCIDDIMSVDELKQLTDVYIEDYHMKLTCRSKIIIERLLMSYASRTGLLK